MAYLHKHNDNNHPHNLPVSIPPQTHHQTHHFPHPLHQLHSVSSSIQHSPLFDSDPISRVIEPNNDINSIDFHVGFGLGFVLDNYNNNNNNSHNPNCDDDFNSGFIVADSDESHETDIISVVDGDCDYDETSFHLCWESFRIQDNNRITPPNPNPNPNPISNSNTHSIANSNAYANEDFEWEEVDDDDGDRIDEREALSMFFGEEPDDDDASVLPVLLTGFAQIEQPREQNDDALEWQVLSNVHNFGPDIDSEDQDQYDDYNYAEYEMFFGQFGDSDVSSLGRPPASKSVVVNLSTVVMTEEDVVNDNALCAVCKDAVAVGEMATQLPCSHRYHGDCILPWLAVRNTCPVCRYELLTDDPDYERRKAERGG